MKPTLAQFIAWTADEYGDEIAWLTTAAPKRASLAQVEGADTGKGNGQYARVFKPADQWLEDL